MKCCFMMFLNVPLQLWGSSTFGILRRCQYAWIWNLHWNVIFVILFDVFHIMREETPYTVMFFIYLILFQCLCGNIWYLSFYSLCFFAINSAHVCIMFFYIFVFYKPYFLMKLNFKVLKCNTYIVTVTLLFSLLVQRGCFWG